MLHEFLSTNRQYLVERCQAKVSERPSSPSGAGISDGVPMFFDQVIKTLVLEKSPEPLLSCKVSGPAGGDKPVLSEIGESAARHGRELLRRGFTINQVVHVYGDVCQAITDLAVERRTPIEPGEFRTLNRCLDNAIADAVTEYSYQQLNVHEDRQERVLAQRLGFFAHELRNHLNSATLALTAIKIGSVGLTGATAGVLDRSLIGLRNLIDRSLSEVRIAAGLPAQHRLQSLAEFVAEVKLAAMLEAQSKGCTLTVSAIDENLAIDVDRDLLFSAVGNLLQNAFKFTHAGTEITVNAYASADRVLIDVADHCGGLPAGAAQSMFLPFVQTGENKSGLGLGLSIAKRSVEANLGTLSVRDVPGLGCVFTISLPRHQVPGGGPFPNPPPS
jgi:signal transduction histidine kinase